MNFIAKSKKAIAAAITGAATGLTATLPPAIADGVFSYPDEFWFVATLTLGGAVLGFAGVWLAPANAVIVEPEDHPIGVVDPADAGADDAPLD